MSLLLSSLSVCYTQEGQYEVLQVMKCNVLIRYRYEGVASVHTIIHSEQSKKFA